MGDCLPLPAVIETSYYPFRLVRSWANQTSRSCHAIMRAKIRPGDKTPVTLGGSSMKKWNERARSSLDTMLAARRFTRRTVLKAGAAAGTISFAGPALVRNALSASGELNLLMWPDEFPDPVIPNFETQTGIKVNKTPFSQNEEQINKLQATGG